MKKLILLLILGCFFTSVNAQKRPVFLHNIKLKTISGEKVSSKIINNFGNPVALIFVEPKKIINRSCKNCGEIIHPSIIFLNDLNKTFKTWQEKYNTKTIVIFHSKKIEGEKIKELALKHNWKFTYYFNTNKKLYRKITDNRFINNQALSLYNGSFANIYNSKFHPKYKKFFCKEKNGGWTQYHYNLNNEVVKTNGDLLQYEEVFQSIK